MSGVHKMALYIKSTSFLDLIKKEKNNRSSSVKVMLALVVFISVFLVILFTQKESAGERDMTLKESIQLSELSPSIITETEVELNKRLFNSRIKPLFYKASIQGEKVNVFVERNGWRNLPLNEKADALLQVAHICMTIVEDSIGISIEPNKAKLPIHFYIHFYDRDSNKELAFWSEQGGIIID
jgi:hypothetical protein